MPAIFGWLIAALFFFYAWVLRVSPSVMIVELMRDFSVGGTLLGQLSAWYFYAYAGMQVPVGVLLDRYGPRRLLTVAALACAVGCALFASGSIVNASLGRFLIGAGGAFSLVGAMAIAARSLPVEKFALLSGLAMMAGMIGGVAGQAPVRALVEATDWRTTTFILAGGGALIAVAAWALIRDPAKPTDEPTPGMFQGLGTVLANRECWLNALAGLACTGPLLGFAALWGIPFLETGYGLSRTSAASVASLTFVGLGVGAPLIGVWSDRLGRRKPPMLVGIVVELAAFGVLVYVPDLPVEVVAVLCLVVGLGAAAQIACYALVREHNPIHVSATAIGLVNALVTSAGAIYQPLVGWLLDLVWNGELRGGAPAYGVEDYRVAFLSILVGGIVGLICACLVKEAGSAVNSAVER